MKYTEGMGFQDEKTGKIVNVEMPNGTSPTDLALAGCQVAQEVDFCRALCLRTLSRLEQPDKDAKKYGYRYFFLDPDQDNSKSYEAIKYIVGLIGTGLAEKGLVIKVNSALGATGVTGYVNVRKLEFDPNGKELIKKGKNNGTLVAAHDSKGGVTTKRAGAIHVKLSTIKDVRIGVQTILHEASHRYGGTHDFDQKGYFSNDGDNPRNPQEFYRPNDALYNADSYGWFILKVGRMQGDKLLFSHS